VTSRVDITVFGLAFAVFGLVALALLWSGDLAYAALANATGNTSATFVVPPDRREACGQAMVMDLTKLLELHRVWTTYVIGASEVAVGPACSLFTSDEYAHMADVRGVFRGAEVAAVVALVVAAYGVVRARRQGGALRLIRAGALVSVAIVGAIGVAAAVAFDSLFLLFHEVFFPQGNFLFAPDSNLIRLYPEWYWQGITAGVGASFIAVSLATAAAAHIALRRRSNTYTRAA
jgi:hypothetical protein